jgi:ligand-binding sensor domain-containing protein
VEDAAGNLWVGTDGAGLFKYDPTTDRSAPHHGFTRYSTEQGLPDARIWSLAMGCDGVLWIGTMTGLCTFDTAAPHRAGGHSFTSIPLPEATAAVTAVILSPTRITCILEDRSGGIWFGRDGGGLFRYDRRAAHEPRTDIFTHYTTAEGLCDDSVSSLMEDRQGNLWIGTMFGGVSRYSPTSALTAGTKQSVASFTNFTKDGVIEGVEVGGFHEDRKGDIWFAAENHGVYRYDGSTFTRYGAADGLDTDGIQSILEDREGRLWAGGWKGLYRFDGRRFFPVGKQGPWEVR